MEITKEDQV